MPDVSTAKKSKKNNEKNQGPQPSKMSSPSACSNAGSKSNLASDVTHASPSTHPTPVLETDGLHTDQHATTQEKTCFELLSLSSPINTQDSDTRASDSQSQNQGQSLSGNLAQLDNPADEILNPSSHNLVAGSNDLPGLEASDDINDSNLPRSKPIDPWHLAFTELRTMGAELRAMNRRLAKLDQIEEEVGALKMQVESVSSQTKEVKAPYNTIPQTFPL